MTSSGNEADRETWVILHCLKDDSHSLVKDSSVVCDSDSLQISDKVKFFYNGEMFDGVVKEIGDDHVKMNSNLKRLNSSTKPKRDGSFCADRPRQSKLKCQVLMKALIGGPSKKASSVSEVKGSKSRSARKSEVAKPSTSTQRKRTVSTSSDSEDDSALITVQRTLRNSNKKEVEQQIEVNEQNQIEQEPEPSVNSHLSKKDNVMEYHNKKADSSSSDSGSESSSSDAAGLTTQELRVLQKLSAKSQLTDYKSLLALAAKSNKVSKKVKLTPENLAHSSKQDVTEPKIASNIQVKAATDEPKIDLQLNVKVAADQPNEGIKIQPVAAQADAQANIPILGDINMQDVAHDSPGPPFKMFRYEASDNDVEELSPGSGIYVNMNDLKNVRKKATSVTACARALVRCVFTKEACHECSVTGTASHGKGASLSSTRLRLDPHGVDTIVDFANKRGLKKHWKEVSDTAIKSSMASLLCEQRNRGKK